VATLVGCGTSSLVLDLLNDPFLAVLGVHSPLPVSGLLGEPALTVTLNKPCAIAVLPDESVVFAERGNHCIRRFDPSTGYVTTLAGTVGTKGFRSGPAGIAQFNEPRGLGVDRDGNVLIADTGNHRIRRLDMGTNNVTTLAGSGARGFADGAAHSSMFNGPTSLAVDDRGNVLVADSRNHRIRRLDMETNCVTTLAGTSRDGREDGSARCASFNCPLGIVMGRDGNVFVADSKNGRIRCLNTRTNTVTTIAGTDLLDWSLPNMEGPAGSVRNPTTICNLGTAT
jgi:DNA-binding beta-propeller fold protein YncE